MGYNIVYGLINFAILAAGLYFVGRKLIPKIFGGNRKKIEDALNEADQAVEDAKSIHKEIEAASTRGAGVRRDYSQCRDDRGGGKTARSGGRPAGS